MKRVALAVVLLLGVSACSSGDDRAASTTTAPTSSSAAIPKPLQLVLDHVDAPTDDTIQVFVCSVPLPTTDPLYGDLPLRIALDPATITAQMNRGVTAYYSTLSRGLYHPTFIAGSVVTMTADETHDQCVEHAVDASDATAAAVMVVATAENLSTDPGGWGRPGTPCATTFCPASTTRRAMYVGASDFYDADDPTGAVSSPAPLLDLIEHEIGHTLDLPHSGDVGDEHASGLDLMSNSAAPRDVQPARIDGPDTIAIDRVALGWMPASAIAVAGADGGRFDLSPSTGADGQRLLVLPIDDATFLTVEYLPATGFDDYLPAGGIAVHLINQSWRVCGHATPDEPCTGVDRQQIVRGSEAPHLQLLHDAAPATTLDGWTIRLTADITGDTATAQVEVHPTDG